MARANFNIVEDNTAPAYQITCQRDGTAINLTGASVDLIIENKSTGSITNTGHQGCTIVTATSGIISYAAEAGDFSSAGTYVGDVKVTYSGGGVEILYGQVIWKVRSKVS